VSRKILDKNGERCKCGHPVNRDLWGRRTNECPCYERPNVPTPAPHVHSPEWWTEHQCRECCHPCRGDWSPNPDSDIAKNIHRLTPAVPPPTEHNWAYNPISGRPVCLTCNTSRRSAECVPPPAEQGGGWKPCVTCGHTLTGTPLCTAVNCTCPDHRGPTLSSAEEWRETAMELSDEVMRLSALLDATRTPQPAGEDPGYVTEHFAEIGRHAAARCNCPEMDGCYSQIRGLAKKGLQEMGAWGDSPVAQSSPASDARAHKYSVRVSWSDEDVAFIALCPELDISAFGSTQVDAVRELCIAAIEGALSVYDGQQPPSPVALPASDARAEALLKRLERELYDDPAFACVQTNAVNALLTRIAAAREKEEA
jgi:predicted RNase H-like HicB family nuclease